MQMGSKDNRLNPERANIHHETLQRQYFWRQKDLDSSGEHKSPCLFWHTHRIKFQIYLWSHHQLK